MEDRNIFTNTETNGAAKGAVPPSQPYQILLKGDLQDLNPISFGEAVLEPNGKRNFSAKNGYFLVHSRKGSGYLVLDGTHIPVKEGQFFVIPVGTPAYLYPTVAWWHSYVGFTGTLSHRFKAFPTVFSLPEEITEKLYVPGTPERDLCCRLVSDLFLVYGYMHQPMQEAPDYVQRVINKINSSYMEKLSVTQMAQELGLNRSYLSRIFTARINMSIQDYILQIRISEAKRYLKHGYSITETALLSGFSSRTTFSSTFLRETGFTPVSWKKAILASPENRPR